jgi:hypothetical protein
MSKRSAGLAFQPCGFTAPLEKPQGRSAGPALPAPDLEGCVSTGQTREQIEKNMQEAIEFHLEGRTWLGGCARAVPCQSKQTSCLLTNGTR